METQKLIYKRAVRNFFCGDKYVQHSGASIDEISDEKTVVSAWVEEKHLNGNGFVQGGMLYMIADFAFAVHANYLHPNTVTQCGQITYLRPAVCKKIIATATETEKVGRNSVAQVTIEDEEGNRLCVCHFNGFTKDVDKAQFIEKYNKGKQE
ncbi:MAG: PaaI family thioesterase [Clostridia bacterium]|nr:PaaI family thioesterase [Clostridia bacterium]